MKKINYLTKLLNNHTKFGVHPTGKKMATYEYNYNGKTYRRRFMNFNKFADEVNLYFITLKP